MRVIYDMIIKQVKIRAANGSEAGAFMANGIYYSSVRCSASATW